MSKWSIIHDYRRHYDAGNVPWPHCPDCEIPLRTVLDKTDDPALRCDGCQSVWTPGTELWNTIRRNLDEASTLQRPAE